MRCTESWRPASHRVGHRVGHRRLHHDPRARRRGYTLIETLIVLAVIGILAALSLTALQVLIPRWRLQDAGRQLDTIIKRARLIAIQRQITVDIRFEDDAEAAIARADMNRFTTYTLVARNMADNAPVARMPVSALSVGIDVDTNTFPGEVIRFDPLGQVSSTGAITFSYLANDPHRRLLSVAITTLNGFTAVTESTT